MNRIRLAQRALLFLWMIVVLSCGSVQGATSGSEDSALLEKYQALLPKLQKNQFDAPIYLESTQSEGSLRVDMYGVFNYPFSRVSQALQSPPNWCDITSLHLNIKACVSRKKGDQWMLTLYSGRKYYQPPSDAHPLNFDFKVVSLQPQYLDVSLTADEGPLGTKDHKMRVKGAAIDSDKTFIHFSYSYSYGTMAKMATKSYLSTLGKDKVGFSTERKDGKTVYIDGVRGAIERNTMRYYLALQTYIESMKYPEPQRFEQRISRWYDLTAKYPRQLKENEKGEYLADKRRERINQVLLQRKESK